MSVLLSARTCTWHFWINETGRRAKDSFRKWWEFCQAFGNGILGVQREELHKVSGKGSRGSVRINHKFKAAHGQEIRAYKFDI